MTINKKIILTITILISILLSVIVHELFHYIIHVNSITDIKILPNIYNLVEIHFNSDTKPNIVLEEIGAYFISFITLYICFTIAKNKIK